MRRFHSLLIGSGLLLLSALPAWAHAFPYKTAPRVGWTVTTMPKQVTIWYTMSVQSGLSRITVKSASGQEVSVGSSHVGGSDHTILMERLKPLAPGPYQVSWHVLAEDGHPTQGHFSFTFLAPSNRALGNAASR